jgi:hypothetical protein
MGYVLTDMKTLEKSSLTSPFHFTIKDNTKDCETRTHDSNYGYHHSYNTFSITQHLQGQGIGVLGNQELGEANKMSHGRIHNQ